MTFCTRQFVIKLWSDGSSVSRVASTYLERNAQLKKHGVKFQSYREIGITAIVSCCQVNNQLSMCKGCPSHENDMFDLLLHQIRMLHHELVCIGQP